MEHLTSYKGYLNEGFFTLNRKSEKSEIFIKLLNLINNTHISQITRQNGAYTIIKKIGGNNENDPMGEEVYEDDISIEFGYDYAYAFMGSLKGIYSIKINDIEIENIRSSEKIELYQLLDNKYENRIKIEREEKINNLLKKL